MWSERRQGVHHEGSPSGRGNASEDSGRTAGLAANRP